MTSELCFTSATRLAARVRRAELSPVEVVEAHLDRIEARGDQVNAYITVIGDRARQAAREAEAAVDRGEDLGPLHGVPVGLKDLSAAKAGVRHTFGCSAFADNVAERTAVFVRRLEAAGAIVLGKTNTPEFGHMPKTDNGLIGATSTPFEIGLNAGGSSGGSAAAVADGQAAIGQGGDAGGSVRIPAAFCGVFGFKPSFGRIPNPSRPDAFGAHTPFTDRGVITRTVADAALALEVMSGPHPRDPFSLPEDGTAYQGSLDRSIDGLTVGYSPDLGMYPVEPRVREVVDEAVDHFAEAGAETTLVSFDLGYDLEEFLERARYPLVQVKTAALVENLRDQYGVDPLGDHRDDFPDAFRDRAEAGFDRDAMSFKRADTVRTAVYDAIQDAFESVDLLVTPTATVLPFSNDELGPRTVDGVPVDPLAGWFPTYVFNLTGQPAASIPAGRVDGLPVGLQVAGRRFADDVVLAASAAYERENPWQEWYPPGGG